MSQLLFHPEVAIEVKSAYDWYQQQAYGLGDDFIDELESVYKKVAATPKRWTVFHKGFRRYLLAKFPFSVIYQEASEDVVYVVAVMHNRRKPYYWMSRVN